MEKKLSYTQLYKKNYKILKKCTINFFQQKKIILNIKQVIYNKNKS